MLWVLIRSTLARRYLITVAKYQYFKVENALSGAVCLKSFILHYFVIPWVQGSIIGRVVVFFQMHMHIQVFTGQYVYCVLDVFFFFRILCVSYRYR